MSTTNVLKSRQFEELPYMDTVSMSYNLYKPSLLGHNYGQLGTPIVFIPGSWGIKEAYALDSQTIANRTQSNVFVVDVRNYGSSPHAQPMNIITVSNDIKRFCEEQKLSKVYFIGFSFGAKVAMATSLRFPDLVQSAVFLDMIPLNQPHLEVVPFQFMIALIDVIEAKISKNDKEWKSKARRILRRHFAGSSTPEYLLRNVVNKKPENCEKSQYVVDFDNEYVNCVSPVYQLLELGIYKDIPNWPDDAVKGMKFNGAVKFVRALRSPAFSGGGTERIHHYFSNVQFAEIDTHHALLDVDTKEYVDIVCNFFNSERISQMMDEARLKHHMMKCQSKL